MNTKDWYCPAYKNREEVDCKKCSQKYNMKFDMYCLTVCGEIEFCRGCDIGIYKQKPADKQED